jgi:hypothetical protein
MNSKIYVQLDDPYKEEKNTGQNDRFTKEEKKALKWLKENAPVKINIKYQNPFWCIDE